jgi:hypothetical protein
MKAWKVAEAAEIYAVHGGSCEVGTVWLPDFPVHSASCAFETTAGCSGSWLPCEINDRTGRLELV